MAAAAAASAEFPRKFLRENWVMVRFSISF
jgi:hypothetical protein